MKPSIHNQAANQAAAELHSAIDAYNNRRVLITGGLGFIGSNLAIRLVESGAKVTVIDSMLSGCGANLFNVAPVASEIRMISAGIGQVEEFTAALAQSEIVFNLAGEVSHSSSMEQPERDLDINVLAQLQFLLACREYCPGARIVYAGTRQLYGKPIYLPVDERHPIQPVDFNGVHKFAATQYHLLLTNLGDLDCVVLRLSNVYGPRMALHLPHQGFLSVFVRRALDGRPIVVFGDGSQLRDPVHVDDVIEAFLLAGTATGLNSRVFNIGGPQAVCIGEVAATVARLGGCTVEHVPFPEDLRNIDIGSYCSDIACAERELSWIPRVWFHEGIETTFQFYRRYREQYLEPVLRNATA